MKTLLIGQAPGRNGDPGTPLLGGKVGSKLIELLGIDERLYRERFDRVNVLDYWPGKSGKGDKFPFREAQKIASAKSFVISGRQIMFVGIGTARAFGFKSAPLRWRKFNGGVAAILPHPSGINHWYNDPRNRGRAERFMRAIAHQ